jgi:hypothetical protein
MSFVMSSLALAAIASFSILAFQPHGTAKTALELSPKSGPPGTVIQVKGIGGFEPGQNASIKLIEAPPQSLSFTTDTEDSLPTSISLATASPSAQYEIDTTVTVPSASEIAETFGEVETGYMIIAIGRNSQIKGVFVARADFTLTGVAPPQAGAATGGNDGHLPLWALSASLGLAAGALLVVWRVRHPRQEDDHGDDARGRPEGP